MASIPETLSLKRWLPFSPLSRLATLPRALLRKSNDPMGDVVITADHYSQIDVSGGDWPALDFLPKELACRGTGQVKVHRDALRKLQALRNRIGKPMIITSAYRSPEHNAAVGGAKNSRHVVGDAFDVAMTNHDPTYFEAQAREVGFTGFGFYGPGRGSFIHIDCGRKREWGERWAAGEFDAEDRRDGID